MHGFWGSYRPITGAIEARATRIVKKETRLSFGEEARFQPAPVGAAVRGFPASTKQGHDLLRQLVGLRDHGVTGLLQDLRPAQVGRF